MNGFFVSITPTILFPIATVFLILWFFFVYWRAAAGLRPRRGTTAWVKARTGKLPRFAFPERCFPMVRRDFLPMLLITAAYACTAFFQLGSFTAPQTYQSLEDGVPVTVALSQPVELTGLVCYSRLGTGSYRLEVSADGAEWRSLAPGSGEGSYTWSQPGEDAGFSLAQTYVDLFKWREIALEEPVTVQFLRLTGLPDSGQAVLQLGELGLCSAAGESRDPQGRLNVHPASAGTEGIPASGADALFDEGDTVPAHSTWYNSSYFDEIYHPRTALEHIEGVSPYEVSHPPLGKLILGLGIRMFGMTPFGWRFMGTLFGVAMLPLLYVFLKNMFGKTLVASCGTVLFAADFMHLTQTRLATIDTYAVFFILLMYYFLYRWLVLPAGTPFRKGVPPLVLSGLFWGIGAACKWTVIYGGIGLAILYFIGLWLKLRAWPAGKPKRKQASQAEDAREWTIRTLALSVLCFIVLPAVIYTLSYLPYAQARGDAGLGNLISVMWENQKYMLSYHKGVDAVHPYSSRWYQWLVDARPILYYLDWESVPGSKAAFGAFVNPVLCWGGLLAVLSLLVRAVIEGSNRLRGLRIPERPALDGRVLVIVVGYLAQLAPWFAIGRTTFGYHYFPSVVFLVLALCHVFDDLLSSPLVRRGRAMTGAMAAGAVGLYALFYPVLIGLMIPSWYGANLLKWFQSWPF